MRRFYLLLALVLMGSGGYLIYKGKDVGAAQNNTNISTSISLDKTIVWFLGGTFGYAAIYVVGKSISDKDE